MPRNRHKKKPANIVPPPAPAPKSAVIPSPVAQKVAQRIMNGGEQYLSDNLERVMIDSARLAEEPEFIDLSFDMDKAEKASERWLKKYQKRLTEADKKSQDEFQQVFDDVRIKIIDELLTPPFRKEVEQRLERLRDRLLTTSDAKKLEIVIMLPSLLGMKGMPWGLCGLIITIYNRAMKPVIEAHEDDIKVYDAIDEVLKEEGIDETDPRSLLESPSKIDRIGQKLFGKKPGLRDLMEKQAWEIVDKFEMEVREGKIALDLFTGEELLLPFHRLDEEYGGPATEMKFTNEQQQHNFEVILQTIREIMTPERVQQMRKDIKALAKTWAHDRKLQIYGPVLEMENDWLEEDFEVNNFVISVFFGQIARVARAQKKKR